MLDYLLEDPVNLKSRERAYSIYYAFRVWNNCIRSGVTALSKNKAAAISWHVITFEFNSRPNLQRGGENYRN